MNWLLGIIKFYIINDLKELLDVMSSSSFLLYRLLDSYYDSIERYKKVNVHRKLTYKTVDL